MDFRGHISDSEARPDLARFTAENTKVGNMEEIRTGGTAGLEECGSTATRAGAASDMPGMLKNGNWLPLVLSQKTRFVLLVFESGGRLGDAAPTYWLYWAPFLLRWRPPFRPRRFFHICPETNSCPNWQRQGALIRACLTSRDDSGGIPPRGALLLAVSEPRGSSRPFRSPVSSIQAPPPARESHFQPALGALPTQIGLRPNSDGCAT